MKLRRLKFKPMVIEKVALDGISKNRKIKKEVEAVAQKKFDSSMEEMIREFNEHPITMELAAGPEAENISGTLSGYGNLFSFIGFHEEEDPVELVRQLLMQFTLGGAKVQKRKGKII